MGARQDLRLPGSLYDMVRESGVLIDLDLKSVHRTSPHLSISNLSWSQFFEQLSIDYFMQIQNQCPEGNCYGQTLVSDADPSIFWRFA
jgi:hypothetical protein